MAALSTKLRTAAELAAMLSLKKVSCTVYEWGEVHFQFDDAIEFVRAFNVLNARKQSLSSSETEKYLHISFRARGASFKTAIAKPKVAEFYAAIGATLKPKLTFAPLGLPAPKGGV